MIQVAFTEERAKDIKKSKFFGKIKTRDGDPVRILCFNAKGMYPIVGLIDKGADEVPMSYTREGKCDWRPNVTSNYDLVIETEGGEV